MSLELLSYLAQIIGSAGVVLSLIFVGLQVRQNTRAIQRKEHNATMAQWTVIRMAIARNRDIAEYMTDGLQGTRANRNVGFLPQYAAVVDALLARFTQNAGAAGQKTAVRALTDPMPDSPAT